MNSFPEDIEAKSVWQAHAHVWNHTMGYINSMSLKCAVELGIADIIHGHGEPIALSQLADKLSIHPSRTGCFRRLMRLLVHSGFFAQSAEEEVFALTALSALLVKEKAESVSPFLLFMLDRALVTPWHSLSSWFKAAEAPTAFDAAHGEEIFEVTKRNPEFNSLLHEAMASDARFVAREIVEECGDVVFRGLRSLVDVGGGTGTMAVAVAEAFPHVKCTVFDLPHVVAPLKGSTVVEVVGGDMFEQVPPADAALLKWVLHDWNDDECVRILQRCKEAIPSKEHGGKVIIIEMVVNVDNCVPELVHTQLLFDVHIMAHTTGKERSEVEWREIFRSAGFSDYKIIPALGLRSIIEVYY